MSNGTSIEWTRGDDGTPGATWNPVIGCDRVGPGCDNCYAIPTSRIREGNPNPSVAAAFAGTTKRTAGGIDWTGRVNVLPNRLLKPLRWRKPRRVFVNSLSDLFHTQVPDAFIASVFAVMALTPQHTYLILTKRHGRMKSLLNSQRFVDAVWGEMERLTGDDTVRLARSVRDVVRASISRWNALSPWPLPNVWLGVSVENQESAELRIPHLLETPAAVRFLSCEPLLGPVDLKGAVWTMGRETHPGLNAGFVHAGGCCDRFHGIDWVIVGGESGPGARPMHPAWARGLRDQCAEAGVPFFFKQWGEYLSVPVEDDPAFAGGRAYEAPGGGRRAAVIREVGGSFRGGELRAMKPGDVTSDAVLLDTDTIAVRVRKKAAGRELDGCTWNQFPQARTCGLPVDSGKV